MIHLDANYNICTQVVECIECHKFWSYVPIGFVWCDPASGWHQDPSAPFVDGYCKPCATLLNELDQDDRRNGNWERRTIEDETYIWAR